MLMARPKKSVFVIDKKTGQWNPFGQQTNAAMQYANQLNNHYAAGGGSSFGGSPMFDMSGQSGMIPAGSGGRTMTNAGQLGVGTGFGVNGVGGQQVNINPTGGSNAAISKLLSDYSTKYQTARNDNLARYDEGKRGYQDRYARNMALLDGTGQQELADIRSKGESAKAQSTARLRDLGLGGTTVGASLDSGIDREVNDSLGAAQDRINQRKVQTDAQLSGDTLGFIERRNDMYPELSGYASLIGTLAENGITDLPGFNGAGGTGGANTPGNASGYISPANGSSMLPAERLRFNNDQRELTSFLSAPMPTMSGVGTPGTSAFDAMQRLKAYGIEIPAPGQPISPQWQQNALKKLQEIWANGGTSGGKSPSFNAGGDRPTHAGGNPDIPILRGGEWARTEGGKPRSLQTARDGVAPRKTQDELRKYLAALN